MEVAVATNYSKNVSNKIDKLRNYARNGVKAAALGGKGDDVPFEQAFSNLAHAYLQDKAPGLMDHEIGFQLLDRNAENTKAVGVFAFKVGSLWLYAPMFFLNGDLKGHELLYLKNQDMFVPLKENWINYLVNRKPNILGQNVDRNLSQLGQRQPDFTQMSRSPSKFGSAKPTLKEMVTAVMPALAKTATMNTARALEDMGKQLNLAQFLKEAKLTTIDFLVKSCQHAPQLASALEQFHGLSIVKEAIDEATRRESATKIASVLSDAPAVSPAVKGLQIITIGVTMQTKLPPETTEEDQEKLLRDGVLILDQRDRDNVSIPYNIQVEKKLFNPTESGLYEILVKPGDVERCYVAVYPQGSTKREKMVTVVRVDGQPDWLNTRADHVFALSRVEGDEFTKWFDALPEANSVSGKSSRYMAISKNGDTTVPFRVLREYGTSGQDTAVYEVHMEDHCKYRMPGDIAGCCYTDPLNYDKYRDGVRIHLNGKKGSKLRASVGDVYVPTGFKLLKVSKGEDDTDSPEGQDSCGCGESKQPPLMPGSLADAQLELMGKTAALVVRHNGSTIEINDGDRISEKQALIALVGTHGLREDAAREVLKQASVKKRFECRVKYAAPYGAPMMINDAPGAPSMPEPVMGGETVLNTTTPTQLGIDQGVPVPGMSAMRTDRSVYNPNPMYDSTPMSRMGDKDLQSVLDAANSGQREVFDTAMIGSMLRAVRDDSLVDRYMGELTKGLDKLGRILFMFYWHGDRFADRYGKSDMPELEDSLRNAFEMLGDVILFLKQKTIEPYPDTAAQDVDLGAVANS
jgi:hypothetical protein